MFRKRRIRNAIDSRDYWKLRSLVSDRWIGSESYLYCAGEPYLLHHAIKLLDPRAVEILLEAGHPLDGDVRAVNEWPESLENILISKSKGDVFAAIQILRLLVKAGLKIEGTVDYKGEFTALMLAAYQRGIERLITEMIRLGADPNEVNRDGRTALFFCINSREHIEALLRAGADASIRDKNGDTAQESACKRQAISGLFLNNTLIDDVAESLGA